MMWFHACMLQLYYTQDATGSDFTVQSHIILVDEFIQLSHVTVCMLSDMQQSMKLGLKQFTCQRYEASTS